MNSNIEKMLDKYNIQTYNGCVEPGYEDKPVALANWNNIPQKVYNALESMGYSCEWEDEWQYCTDCYKVFRTSPNSYGWQKYYSWIGECDIVCGDCIKENPDGYFESLENNPAKCETLDLNLTDYGYELAEDGFEHGFHEYQTDNPEKILEKYLEKYPEGKFIFRLDEVSQFDIHFSIYKKVE